MPNLIDVRFNAFFAIFLANVIQLKLNPQIESMLLLLFQKRLSLLFQFTCRLLAIVPILSLSSMKSIRTADGVVGKGIVHVPRSGDYRHVVIWLHGLGDTADGWASLMPEFGLEHTKFILPTAPKRPISLNGGMLMNGWSDIYGLSSSDREDESGFVESRERIHGIVKAEVDAGIEPSKVILIAS